MSIIVKTSPTLNIFEQQLKDTTIPLAEEALKALYLSSEQHCLFDEAGSLVKSSFVRFIEKGSNSPSIFSFPYPVEKITFLATRRSGLLSMMPNTEATIDEFLNLLKNCFKIGALPEITDPHVFNSFLSLRHFNAPNSTIRTKFQKILLTHLKSSYEPVRCYALKICALKIDVLDPDIDDNFAKKLIFDHSELLKNMKLFKTRYQRCLSNKSISEDKEFINRINKINSVFDQYTELFDSFQRKFHKSGCNEELLVDQLKFQTKIFIHNYFQFDTSKIELMRINLLRNLYFFERLEDGTPGFQERDLSDLSKLLQKYDRTEKILPSPKPLSEKKSNKKKAKNKKHQLRKVSEHLESASVSTSSSESSQSIQDKSLPSSPTAFDPSSQIEMRENKCASVSSSSSHKRTPLFPRSSIQYDPRVLASFEQGLSSVAEEERGRVFHAFSKGADPIIERLGVETIYVTKKGEKHLQKALPGWIEWDGRKWYGAFVYTWDNEGLCYHRFFHNVGNMNEFVNEMVVKGVRKCEFPSLGEAYGDKTTTPMQTAKASQSSSSKAISSIREDLEEIEVGEGIFTIKDTKNGATLHLFTSDWINGVES